MLSLRDTASMEAALKQPLPYDLKELLRQRMEQLRSNYDGDLADIVNFVVMEPGDTLRKIEQELGFSILENMCDRTRFGDPDFTPSWEWIACHGSWFELVYILSDDGFGIIVFVPNDPSIEFDLHSLCQEYACC